MMYLNSENQTRYHPQSFNSTLVSALMMTIVVSLGAFHNFFGVFLCLGLFVLYAVRDNLVLKLNKTVISLICLLAVLIFTNAFPSKASYLLKLESIARFSGFIFFAYLVLQLTAKTRIYTVFLVSALIAFTMLLYFTFGMFTVSVQGALNRFGSIFIHSNHNAYVSLYLLISIYAIREKYNLSTFESRVSVCLGIALILSILLTKSSGGLIVLAVFIGVVFIGSRTTSLIFKIIFMSITIIGILFLGEAVQLTIEKFSEVDVSLIEQRADQLKFGGYGSLSWRLGYWIAIYNAFLESDAATIMLGYGSGVMSKGNYLYFFMDKDPHNDFLLLLVENGVFGLVSVFLILKGLVKTMHFKWLIGFALFLPMLWGNIISSFPVFSTYILMLSFYHNKQH